MKLTTQWWAAFALAALSASAQTKIAPDCIIDFSFTAAGQTQGGVGTCGNNTFGVLQWTLWYKATGFSALSLRVESASDSSGSPGSWGAFGGMVASGVNPNTATTEAATQLTGFEPWVRVVLTSKTGTGSATGQLYGCRQPGCSGGLALSVPPSGPAGGDLCGTYPDPTVCKVNGTPYGTGAAHQVPVDGVYKTLPNCPADALAFTQGTDTFGCNVIPTALPPSGTAGGDLSGTYPNPGVAKVNGTAYGSSPAAHQVPIVGVYKTLPNCPADALGFTQATDTFGCNVIPTSLPPSGACGGDLGGTYPNCTVVNASHVTNNSMPNSGLVNSGTTVDGSLCTLGSSCTPSATLNGTNQTGFCTGVAYTLTATLATVVCGTTSPTMTISTAGTYLLMWNARVDHVAATYAANRTITVTLARTNNTPGTITSGGQAIITNILTTTTETAEGGNVSGFVQYTTANTNDVIVLQASVSVLPTAGATNVSTAKMLALRLF